MDWSASLASMVFTILFYLLISVWWIWCKHTDNNRLQKRITELELQKAHEHTCALEQVIKFHAKDNDNNNLQKRISVIYAKAHNWMNKAKMERLERSILLEKCIVDQEHREFTPGTKHFIQLIKGKSMQYNFKSKDKLGKGAFGTVYLGEDTKGRKVAVKVIDDPEVGIQEMRNLETILYIMRKVGGKRHMMTLLNGPWRVGRQVCLPLILCDCSLATLIYGPLNDSELIRDCWGIGPGLLGALKLLHEEGFVHGDIKPTNVLIKNKHAVLADFDAMVKVDDVPLSEDIDTGTLHYKVGENALGSRECGNSMWEMDIIAMFLTIVLEPISRKVPWEKVTCGQLKCFILDGQVPPSCSNGLTDVEKAVVTFFIGCDSRPPCAAKFSEAMDAAAATAAKVSVLEDVRHTAITAFHNVLKDMTLIDAAVLGDLQTASVVLGKEIATIWCAKKSVEIAIAEAKKSATASTIATTEATAAINKATEATAAFAMASAAVATAKAAEATATKVAAADAIAMAVMATDKAAEATASAATAKAALSAAVAIAKTTDATATTSAKASEDT